MDITDEKDQHRRQYHPIGIIIGHSAQHNPCGEQKAALPVEIRPSRPEQRIKYNRHRQHRHRIRIHIGMNKYILRQEDHQKRKRPLDIRVSPCLLCRFADKISHQDTKADIDHAGGQQKRTAVFRKQLQKPEQKTLNNISQNRLKSIGCAIPRQNHLGIGPMREYTMAAYVIHDLKTINLIRRIAERLHHGKTCNRSKYKQIKDDFHRQFQPSILIPLTLFSSCPAIFPLHLYPCPSSICHIASAAIYINRIRSLFCLIGFYQMQPGFIGVAQFKS